MKRIILVLVSILYFEVVFPQAIQVGAGFGATIVNLNKVIGSELSNYNKYSYEFLIQAMLKSKHDRLQWMPEIGIHRLYYWEEQYTVYVPNPVQRWRWGTIWTAHAGFGLERSLFNYGYLQTGANIRYFLDGSGVTPGLMAGAGIRYKLSARVSVPLGVRLDVVFGKGTPSAFTVCTGVEFGKRDR